jgi:N-acetyl-anhydromuramyl-L-alanine amidase AmpD
MTLQRIILHWSAGAYYPNATDLEHYHFVIDKDGVVKPGKCKPEDNLNCYDGKYAAHTGGGNTGSIGVAYCGMAGFINAKNPGKYPLTAQQVEAGFKLCAELCKKYNIPINNVMTHYEFGKLHPKTKSFGKIDIIHLPSYPHVSATQMGTFIRQKIHWYYSKLFS